MTALATKNARRGREPSKKHRDDNLIRGDVDLEKFILKTVAKGIKDIRVEDAITTGRIVRTIDGGSAVSVTIHDSAREILRSGKLHDKDGRLQVVDVKLDGLWFRLTKISKTGDDLNLTFEDRIVARLRDLHGPRRAADRAQTTRAQYILQLVRAVKQEKIPVRIHELKKVQEIKGLPRDDSRQRRKEREKADEERRPGFAPGSRPASLNARQIRRVETCMNVAERLGVSELVVLSMLVAMAGESDFGENVGSRGTTFQTLMIPEAQLATQAYHFLKGGRSFRTGGAIGYARANPSATPGLIAKMVEISDGSSAYYDSFRSKARKILDAWGGQTSSTTYRVKKFTFKVDKKESYWDAIQRLAKQVGWRAFISGGKFYYISEEDLYRSRPRYRLSEDMEGVGDIDFDWDQRKKVGKLSIPVRMARWAVPPGTVVLVEEMGPASGRWLCESVDRNLFSTEGTLTLKKPMSERKEPAPEREQVSGQGGEGWGTEAEGGSFGGEGPISGDIGGLVPDMIQFLKEISGNLNRDGSDVKISISSGRRVDPGSNHNTGSAADIDVFGDAHSSSAAGDRGDRIAVAVLVTCGVPRDQARKLKNSSRTDFSVNSTWHGHSVEIGWKTMVGGNHYTHVHVGFDT